MNESVDAARRELLDALRAARGALERARANAPSDAHLVALHRQALGGGLGPDMVRLARRVAEGRTTWAAVFSGASPDGELARAHVARMSEAQGPRLREELG